jgi:hypothetical protein
MKSFMDQRATKIGSPKNHAVPVFLNSFNEFYGMSMPVADPADLLSAADIDCSHARANSLVAGTN